jgi:uncharacterized membrane protein YgcG
VLPRRREEILKLLRLKRPDLAFLEAHDLGILTQLSPTMAHAFDSAEHGELFLESLRQIGDIDRVGMTPVELFALLVHAYVRACLQPDPLEGPRARSVLDDENFQTWMRDELGMFKFEQALTVKALHVEPLLARRREFQKRGERRQRALLTNEAFPLALRFAGRDYCVSCEDQLYWSELYTRLKSEDPSLGSTSTGGRPKRRRPRRPRRGGRRGSSSSSAGGGSGDGGSSGDSGGDGGGGGSDVNASSADPGVS